MGSERWGRTRSRVAVGIGTAGIALALTAPPAGATTLERCSPVGCVRGTISVVDNRSTWNLQVLDSNADGYCVYAKIQIDVADGLDPEYRSDNACPKGEVIPFVDADAYANTLGASIHICRSNGLCRKVHYESAS